MSANKPAARLWLVGGLLIAAGVVGRVVLHDAAPAGPGYIHIMTFQMLFYGVGLVVLGFWVLTVPTRRLFRAITVWLATAAVCAILTCASSPK